MNVWAMVGRWAVNGRSYTGFLTVIWEHWQREVCTDHYDSTQEDVIHFIWMMEEDMTEDWHLNCSLDGGVGGLQVEKKWEEGILERENIARIKEWNYKNACCVNIKGICCRAMESDVWLPVGLGTHPFLVESSQPEVWCLILYFQTTDVLGPLGVGLPQKWVLINHAFRIDVQVGVWIYMNACQCINFHWETMKQIRLFDLADLYIVSL